MIGSRILKEATNRGHSVTAVARHIEAIPGSASIHPVTADAQATQQLSTLAAGQQAIVSALSPRGDRGREQYLASIRSVLAVAKSSPAAYVLFVGGTSNLFTTNGRRILDQWVEEVGAANLAEPIAVAEARAIIEQSGANWTFFCPCGKIEPGERTGKFRLGGSQAVVEPWTDGHISAEDYAVAAVDELEHPQHQRQIFNISN